MLVEMDRRPFDRSREPGLKKARLSEDSVPNPNRRSFPQRTAGSTLASRLRGADSESSEAYEPQPLPQQQQNHELISQYKTALAELTFNSKPIITNLTIIAGENVQVAKSIAALICTNIIEVPSDQKLPSLYLLDSIVKNIGEDYIKYFAAKLPEVFIKAYRQVDAPVHQSMRHLFGTWKGVFPQQSLQMIEKELGFTPLANGSSSRAPTSRLDPKSQRPPGPPHSIHVNPKYLERQRLQQPSRANGMLNDITGAMTDVKEDSERSDSAALTGRTWVDSSAKMTSVQRSHRDSLGRPLHEKNISTAYGDYDYDSDLSQNSALGIGRNSGRVIDQIQDRSWHGTGNTFQETISTQRNGLNAKHGLRNSKVSKSVNADPRLRAANSTVNRSNSGLSSSWKNSEEEEFMWEMHSRLSDHDAATISSNSRKERWVTDDPEKLEFGNHLRGTKSIHDGGSRFDREASADSPAWSLQEPYNLDGSIRPALSDVKPEGYSASLGRLATSTSSSQARTRAREQFGSSKVGSSGFSTGILGSTGMLDQQHFPSLGVSSPPGQSPVHQRSSSPSIPARDPRQKRQDLAEEDHPQAHSLRQHDSKPSKFSGQLNAGSRSHSAIQPALPTLPSFQSSQQKSRLPLTNSESSSLKLGNMSALSDLHAVKTSGLPSDTSSLLAAVLNSGIIPGTPSPSVLDGGKMPSQSGVKHPLPSGPSPAISAAEMVRMDVKALSNDVISAATNVPQKKSEQPPLPPGPPPSSLVASASAQPAEDAKAVNPLSNLLSSLVAKGLISASKSESQSVPSLQIPNKSQEKSSSIATSGSKPDPLVHVSSDIHSSTKNDVKLTEAAAKSSSSLSQSEPKKVENLVGTDFKPDVIREFHPSVIDALLDDLPHKCSLCGFRLKLEEQLVRHLEWHAMKNPDADEGIGPSRRWYAIAADWLAGKPGQIRVESAGCLPLSQNTTEKGEPTVPADENQCACIICGELFEELFSQETGDWMFNGAVYMTIPTKGGEANENAAKGPIVHSNCISESSLIDLGLATAIKMEKDD